MKGKSAIPASLRKRLLALLCAVCLCVTLLPVSVLAEGGPYTLTLNDPLGTAQTEYITEYTLGTPTKVDGFTFRYWEDENKQTYESGTTITLTGDLELTAIYTLNSDEITVGEGSYNNRTHEYTTTITTTNRVLADEDNTVSVAYIYSVNGAEQEATVGLESGSATIPIREVNSGDSVSIDEITSVTLNGTTYAVEKNVAPVLTWDKPVLYTDTSNTVWAQAGATVTLTITDADSDLDVDNTKIALNDVEQDADTSSTSSCVYTLTLTEGENRIAVSASDAAGNTVEETCTIRAENTAPTIAVVDDAETFYTDSDGNMWAIKADQVSFTKISDAESGLKECSAQLGTDGDPVTLTYDENAKTYTIAYSSLSTGENTITVTASDNVGNTATETFTVYKDTDAPAVTLTREDSNDISASSDTVSSTWKNLAAMSERGINWLNKTDRAVTYTVGVSDEGSGVRSVEYAEVEFSDYSDYDNAAELESALVEKITSWSDATESEDGYTITLNNVATAEHVLVVRVTDNAGNVTYVDSDGVLFDSTAPVVTVTYTYNGTVTTDATEAANAVYSKTDITVTIKVTDDNLFLSTDTDYTKSVTVDDESKNVEFAYDPDAGTWSGTVTVSGEGEHTLSVVIADAAGNESEEVSNSKLCISSEKPTIALTVSNGEDEGGLDAKTVDGKEIYYVQENGCVTITLADEKGYLGSDRKEGGRDQSSFTVEVDSKNVTSDLKKSETNDSYKQVYTLDLSDYDDGEYTIAVSVTNQMGSAAENKKIVICKDSQGPAISVSYAYENNSGEQSGVACNSDDKDNEIYAKGAITATITVTDENLDPAGDGADLTVKIGDEEQEVSWTKTTDETTGEEQWMATVTIGADENEDGTYTLTVDAADEAGNQAETYTSGTMNVDTAKPEVTSVTLSKTNSGILESILNTLNTLTFGNFFSAEVTLTVTATDETGNVDSGVASITVYDENGAVLIESDELSTETNKDGTVQAIATFTMPLENWKDFFSGTLSVSATDGVGNESEAVELAEVDPAGDVKSSLVMYETYEPVAALTVGETEYTEACYTDSDGNYWVKYGEAMTIAVEDADSGLYTAEVALNGDPIISFSTSVDAKTMEQKANILYSDLAPGKNTIHVSAVDNAGNDMTQDFVVYQDTQAPAIDSVRISGYNANRSTGAYANGDVTLTVVVNDVQSGFTSGLASAVLTYVYTTEEGGEQTRTYTMTPNEDLTAAAPGQVSSAGTVTLTYTLDADQVMNTQGSFSLTLADNVGNRATYNTLDGFGSTNLKVNSLTVENTSPQVSSVTISTPDYTDSRVQDGNGNSQAWYDSTDVQFVYTVSDQAETPYAGVAYVDITINRHALDTRTYVTDTQRQSSRVGSFNLSDSECAAYAVTGENVITIRVTDDAGNVSETYTGYVYVDADGPVVTSYSFTPANKNGASTGTSVVVTDYGYFFSEDTSITVTVEDSAPSSGIAVVRFVTVSIDGTVSEYSQTVNPTSSVSQTTQATATFTVPKGFKGQIYAQAEDHVGHVQSAGDTSFTGYEGMWCRPDGVVTETQQLHDQRETHISIELLSEPVTYLDGSSNPLYNADVQVKLTVTDIYAGIQSIEYTVVSAYDTGSNQSGTLSMVYGRSSTANGTGESLQYAITQTNSDGRSWSVDREDLNLVTQMSKTLTVSNNSNDIVIYVKMTDNCGNVSEQELVLSIDKDAPVVTVSYNNNAALNDKYFNEDRVMTVTVVERNFNGAEIDCTVDGTAVSFGGSLAEWTVSGPDGDGNYTYTLTRTFHNDGDYLFAMSVTDLADNLTADAQVSYQGTATQDFVMDQTAPVISLSLNGAFSNGYYLQADSSVTVTVNEHNFDASGYTAVARFVSASDATDTFLAAGTWSTTGDVSTVTFDVAVEGDYYIDTVTFIDLAGNEQTVTGEEFGLGYFVLDKTAPVIQILTGVGGEPIDKTASQGEVTPTIVIEDYTFNSAAVEYTLTGYRNGDVTDAYAASRSDEETGCTIIYVNFDEEETVDDIYVLTVTVTDLAGNSTPASATFSVNRFGSTYMLSQDTYDTIQSTYLNEEKTITVVEINPDRLTEQSVTVTRGSNTATLTEGEDYTVEEEGPWDSQADTWNTDSHWYQYTYTIAASNFVTEGEYTISLYSEDEADNSQTNEKTRHTVNLFSGEMNTLVTSEDENPAQAQVTFVIDKTSPIVSFLNLDKSSYRASSLDVSIQATDETKIADLEVWVDGELMETVDEQTLAQDGYTYVYTMASKGQRQSIELVAHDQAGNSSVLTDDNSKSVLITTNLWIQFINSWLAITIACVVVAAAAAGIILLLWRRRKEEKETENV